MTANAAITAELVVQAASIPRVPNAFLDYLRANAHVYLSFEALAFSKVRIGFTRYSSRAIIHILRHESEVREDQPSVFKISDHVSPYFSRLFAVRWPQHEKFFQMNIVKKTEDSPL